VLRRVAFRVRVLQRPAARLVSIRQHVIVEYLKGRGRMAVGQEADRGSLGERLSTCSPGRKSLGCLLTGSKHYILVMSSTRVVGA
jgi:hypothetical protein